MNWTIAQQNQALADGWGVFDNSDHGMRIERNDETARFNCDAAAQAYTVCRALTGDRLARTAWLTLAFHHRVADAASRMGR